MEYMKVISVNWRIIDTHQETDFDFRCSSKEGLIGAITTILGILVGLRFEPTIFSE